MEEQISHMIYFILGIFRIFRQFPTDEYAHSTEGGALSEARQEPRR